MNIKIIEIFRIFFFNTISASVFVFFLIKFRKKCISQKNNILFINSGFLGDNILASLILVNDELFVQGTNISLLLNEKYKALFSDYTGSIKLFYCNLEKYRNRLKYRIELLNFLRSEGFSEVYNINFVRHTIDDELTILSTCGRSYAFENNKKLTRFFEGLYTKRFSKIITLKSENNFIELSKLIQTITSKKIVLKTKLYFKQEQSKPKLNIRTGEYIIVAPLSSKFVKEYPLEKYLELINYVLLNFDFSIVVVGDRKISIKNSTDKRLINITGRTNVLEVLQLIKDSKLFIGNDSGLLHAAIALGKKCIGIVGGGVWGRIYPYGNYLDIDYLYKYLECFNCDWHCIYKKPKCLYEIDVDNLIKLVDQKLKEN